MLTKRFLNSLRQSFNRRNGYILYNTAAFTNNYIRISNKIKILRSTNKLQIQDTCVSNRSILYRTQLYTYYIHECPFLLRPTIELQIQDT